MVSVHFPLTLLSPSVTGSWVNWEPLSRAKTCTKLWILYLANDFLLVKYSISLCLISQSQQPSTELGRPESFCLSQGQEAPLSVHYLPCCWVAVFQVWFTSLLYHRRFCLFWFVLFGAYWGWLQISFLFDCINLNMRSLGGDFLN